LRKTLSLVAAAVAAVMVAPGAMAWYSYGSNEPDNHFDRDPAFMFQGLPSGSNQVYFNVFSGVSGGVSPNSATLGDRLATGLDSFSALLGVWVDCNHDGYVGMADGALREYRAEVANLDSAHKVDTTICPVVPDDAAHAGMGLHNSNGWITEMIPLGSSSQNHGTVSSTDHRTAYDRFAMVWGENGDPGLHEVAPGAPGCPSLLGSEDQIKHTGGILTHQDCGSSSADAIRSTLVSQDPTGTLNAIPVPSSLYAPGGPADQPVPQAVSGDDGSSHSYVNGLADCSKDPLVDTSTVTTHPNSGEGKSGVRPPGSPSVNPNGDARGTANYTHEITPDDDCNTANDQGRDFDSGLGFANVVARDSGVDTTNVYKSTAGMLFSFRPWNSRVGTAKNGCGTGATGAACGTPQDAGLPQVYTYESTGDNMWSRTAGGPGLSIGGPGIDVTRLTLDPSYAPALWYTFYASVSRTDVSTPGGVGTYGDEACTSGIGRNAPPTHGWECDPNNWWLIDGTHDHNLGYADTEGHYYATVGDSYQFRDVDCYDETIASAGSPTGYVGVHSVPVLTKDSARCQ
jgi:hypothetical protein